MDLLCAAVAPHWSINLTKKPEMNNCCQCADREALLCLEALSKGTASLTTNTPTRAVPVSQPLTLHWPVIISQSPCLHQGSLRALALTSFIPRALSS